MAEILWCVCFFACCGALGYAITALVLARQARPVGELAALSFALGLGGYGYVLFLCSLAGLPPRRWLILVIAGVAAAVVVLLHLKKRNPQLAAAPPERPDKSGRWLVWAGLLCVLGAVGAVTLSSLASGMTEWDAFAIWDLKAKVLYREGIWRAAYFRDGAFAYSHLAYPLGLPFEYAAIYAVTGTSGGNAAGVLAKTVCVATFIGLCALAYTCLRRWLRAGPAAVLTAFMACLPIFLIVSSWGYADITVALFCLGSIHYLVQWERQRDWRDLVLAGIFTVYLANTKYEGMPLAQLFGLVLLVFAAPRLRRLWHLGEWDTLRLAGAAAYFGGFLVLSGPFLIWQAQTPGLDEGYAGRLGLVLENLDRLPQVAGAFLRAAADLGNWGPLWFLLILAAVLGFRAWKKRPVRMLWIILAGHFMLYILAYIITPHELAWHLSHSLDRLLIHLAPAAFLLIAAHWASVLEPLSASVKTVGKKRAPAAETVSAETIPVKKDGANASRGTLKKRA